MSITSLNLSVTARCNARCIFCPQRRGNGRHGDMSLAVVDELLRQVTRSDFPWRVENVRVGENGEATLCATLLPILRRVRRALPCARVHLTSNFQWMDGLQAAVIAGDGLVDSIGLNVDGHDEASYGAQKGLELATTLNNLRNFLDARDRAGRAIRVEVSVLPLALYSAAVWCRFGRAPHRLPTFPQEAASTFAQVEVVVTAAIGPRQNVIVRAAPVMAWAERPGSGHVAGLQCPQLPRLASEAFIAPDGTWYACCLDAEHELAYGSAVDVGLCALHDGERRRELLARLESKQFAEIGGPCASVDCCQVIA